jgi:uncharacterized damage-inducible protein DinB
MMWTPRDASRLFAYTRWASGKTLDAVEALAPEELTRAVGGSFGSVHATLAHMWGADWIWLERWLGRSPARLPDPKDVPTLALLRKEWSAVQNAQKDFVESVSAEGMAGPLSYQGFDGKPYRRTLGDAFLHVANHGTYHRGQIATLLRQLGKTPASTDFFRYVDVEPALE